MNRDLPGRPGPAPAPEPLDAEERALAERLARLGPHGEPSAALDARILGAASDALVEAAAGRRRRPRWPAPLALAASVVFAVGIAWQLREPASERAEHAAAAPQRQSKPPTASTIRSQPPVTSTPPAKATPAAPPAPAESARAAPRAVPPPAPSRPASVAPAPTASEPARSTPPASSAPVAPTRAPATATTPIPSAQAPPAEAQPLLRRKTAPTADRAARAPLQAEARVASTAAIVAAEKETPSEFAEIRPSEAPATDVVTDTDTDIADASADAAAIADAVAADAVLPPAEWLARIAQRRDRGEAGIARASLQRFVEDHPRAQVPADLRHLLEE